MFIDKVDIFVYSGKGGAGAVSFRREKFIAQGGPDGGDGGDGGDVYFQVSANCDTLSRFRGKKHYKAQDGMQGKSKNMKGKSGKDITIIVPPGTQIIDYESQTLVLDLKNIGDKVLFLKGGKGGLGNTHFKNSTNQAPTYAQKGTKGKEAHILLELKLIADVGLVGFPNVGKSTLVSTISNATPEVADYAFTTLIPSLGVVNIDEYRSFVMADIPGIIKGASIGKGLGLEFLRHIERTNILLYVLDIAFPLQEQFCTLQNELKLFSEQLFKKPYAIIISRTDIVDAEQLKYLCLEFIDFLKLKDNTCKKYPIQHMHYISSLFMPATVPLSEQKDIQYPAFVIPISSHTHDNINILKFILKDFLEYNSGTNRY